MFFNYESLWLLGFGNAEVMVAAFKKLHARDQAYMCLTGDNYILNPNIIVKNPYRLTDQQLAEYLGLCALRSYHYYQLHGYKDLDMARVPEWVSASIVKSNPLIEINKTELIFKEEIICLD